MRIRRKCWCSGARTVVAILGVLCCGAQPAAYAHIGSSDTTNNRYYRIAPMADRVRIAYTIFFGSEPAFGERKGMDRDGDGLLSSSEIRSFSTRWLSEISRSFRVTSSGKTLKVHWQVPEMEMGEARVGKKAFSLDLIGTVCLDRGVAASEHRLHIGDDLLLVSPGEGELFLDPAPGIRVSQSRRQGQPLSAANARWTGGAGLARQGYDLEFFVDNMESAGLDVTCQRALSPAHGSTFAWLFIVAAALLFALVLTMGWRRVKQAQG